MGEDIRQYPRIAINAFIRFYEKSVDRSEQQYLQGMAKNYSDGGIFISTKHLLPKGSVITLEIPIECGPQNLTIIQIHGVVRWVGHSPGGYGMGIEFFEFKDSESKNFAAWMANLVD